MHRDDWSARTRRQVDERSGCRGDARAYHARSPFTPCVDVSAAEGTPPLSAHIVAGPPAWRKGRAPAQAINASSLVRLRAQELPVSLCGAATGFDSGDPRWRRKTDNHANEATARNSLCQFWKDWNQNSEVRRNAQVETASPPCVNCSSLYSWAPPQAWRAKQTRNSRNNDSVNECS